MTGVMPTSAKPTTTATNPQVIGVDLGGTAIKLGRFDAAGQILQTLTVPTPQPAEPEAVLEAIAAAIHTLDPDRQSLAIGIGTPGPVDETGRIALVAINLGWKNVPLADVLEVKVNLPVIAANDANCAGLGESWLGAGQRYRDVLMLTLGTGVGGAVILDGKLFVGRHGTGAELGLITLDPSGVTCNSGNHGSLEQLVSVQAIRRTTGMEPAELGQRAASGDREAIAFWETYGRDLGAGIANLVYIFTPEAVILGGGISASAPYFMPSLLDEIEKRVLPTSREGLHILTAELGNQAGMVGAAKLAWQRLESEDTTFHGFTGDSDTTDLHLAYHLAVEAAEFNAGFLARTAHELRAPINGIIGLHQLILADLCDNPEEEREFVAQAHQTTVKMLALLDEVIQVSKISLGKQPLKLQPVNLAGLIKTVHQSVRLYAQDRNARLEIPPIDPKLHVEADPDWLRRVLVHRLNHAIAQDKGSILRFSVEAQPNQQVCLQLDDTCATQHWQEAIDWMETTLQAPKALKSTPVPTPTLSPELLLHVDQLILERMGSRLELEGIPPDCLRVKFSLPLAAVS